MALGEPGEICIKGPQVMAGYWNRPDETAKVMTPDGFFMSGDIGVMDAKGFIRIVDRKKDIIISGGENISSLEIERAINSHPCVKESAVVAVPDAKWGEVPKAFVVLAPAAQLTEQELLQSLREKLAHFKVPRRIEFIAELPKGGTGKIQKKMLRRWES